MGKVEGRTRHSRGEAGRPRGPHFVRLVAAGCAALVLASGAYQAAYGGQGGGDPNKPPVPDYDDGISAAEAAGIAAAGLAAIAAISAASGGGFFGRGDGCPQGQLLPNGDARILPPLPANCTITELCLAPESTKIDAGMCRVYDLRAKCREDKKWYSVTGRAEASIEVRDIIPGTPVVRLEGSKNTFCVPITVPQTANGRSVVVRGTYAPGGRAQPMHAEARIVVRTPGRSVPPVAPPEEVQPKPGQ